MSQNSGYGLDVILVDREIVGGISAVKNKLQTLVASADLKLSPKESHVLFNWRNPVISAEIAPIVTMRLGTTQYPEVIYGRKVGHSESGQYVVYPFSLHVWAEKLNYEIQEGNESEPATDLADKIVTLLLKAGNDANNSGICYFYGVTARESEPERGPQNFNRVVIEGFIMVKRLLS
jgi:hypothetical protein